MKVKWPFFLSDFFTFCKISLVSPLGRMRKGIVQIISSTSFALYFFNISWMFCASPCSKFTEMLRLPSYDDCSALSVRGLPSYDDCSALSVRGRLPIQSHSLHTSRNLSFASIPM